MAASIFSVGCQFGMDHKKAHENSDKDFLRYLEGKGKSLSSVTFSELIDICLSFYREVQYPGLDSSPSSDMLLFEWGVFDWGEGEFFQIGITRQLIAKGTVDDDGYTQLLCDAFYVPTPQLVALKSSNKWCRSRDEINSFQEFVLSSEAYRVASGLKPLKVVIRTDGV